MPDAPKRSNSWQNTDIFDPPIQIDVSCPERNDSPLFNDMTDWDSRDVVYTQSLQDANLFVQHPEAGVCMADLERVDSHQDGDMASGEDFTTFWNQQRGVQQFPFDDPPSNQQQ